MDDDELQELDAWGKQVATLESATRNEIVAALSQLAGNPQLDETDRDFAQAQVDAIRRAVRRAKAPNKKS